MAQFQIIITAIFCIAIFSCWLVFSKGFNIGIAPIVAIGFLLLSLGLLFWVFFIPSGKKFAHNYNKLQQDRLEAERTISSIAQTLIIQSKYTQMMLDFQKLSTFQQVEEWDRLADLEIQQIINSVQTIESEIAKYSDILGQFNINQLKQRYIVVLENMAEKLQEAIDFTPNSIKEQKILLKELKQQKKELQLKKRELTANMRSIQADARSRSIYAGRGFLGIYDSKLAAHERRRIRYQKEEALRPSEDIKAAIDRQILQIDKDILWVERFSD